MPFSIRLALLLALLFLTTVPGFSQKPEIYVSTGHTSLVNSVAFSADSKTLASGSMDGTIRLWDVASGQELKTLKGHSSDVNSVAFTPDGKTLASASDDNTIKLWDVVLGQELKTLKVDLNPVVSMAFSPDGKTLVSVCGVFNRIIKLWDVSSGQEVKTLKGHSGVTSFAFSPDGKMLASGSWDGTIKLWDALSGQEWKTLDGHSGLVTSLVFRRDGKTLASGCGHTIKLWNVAVGQELKTLKGHSSNISSVVFSFDGKTLASRSDDNTIKLWDVAAGQELKTLKAYSSNRLSFAFSPDGKMFASGVDNTIKLSDVPSGEELKTLKGHSSFVFSVAFSPDGKTLASGSSDDTVKLLDIASGQEWKTLNGHSDHVTSVAFSPDGKVLASGSKDATIRLWDVASGQELKTLKGQSSDVYSIAFSPDGTKLGSGGSDTVDLWDVSSGRELITIKRYGNYFYSVAFSPDGKMLASGSQDTNISSEDATIKLWDVASGLELKTLKGHSSYFTSVVFSPDGKTLASRSADSSIGLWDLGSGDELASLIALDEKEWVVVTPDGRFDGSLDGMKLISYVQDNKLLPLDSFFEQFYSPKLLQKVYARQTLPPTTSRVDFSKRIKLPPLVRIASPKPGTASNSDTAQIVVEAMDQGGGIEDIRLFQNGKLVSEDTRQLTREITARSQTFEVTLLPGVNTFRATAFNNDRTESTPDEIKIELKAVEASSNLYILAIGLNEYKNTRYNLNYGRADAQAFADTVEQRGRGIFKEIKKRTIFDADATRANIEAAFSEIIKQSRPQDAFVFYYAGHGVMSENDSKNPADFYLVPYEVLRIYGDDGGVITKGIAARNLRELLKNVRAQKQLIVLDACESGGAVESIAMRGASEEKAIAQLARSAGVAVFASAGQDQVATEFGKLGHGVFTYSLLKGLSGEADGAPRDGKITIKELEAYINDQVPELTKRYRGKRQDPNSWTRGQDFPIAIQ